MIEKIKKFNKNKVAHEKLMPASARILDIQSELGELSKEYLKSTNYGTKEFVLTEDFELEYADVLYSIISLGQEMGIDIEKSVDKVLAKYQKRIDEKKNMGSGR